jgi:hypothetical protein
MAFRVCLHFGSVYYFFRAKETKIIDSIQSAFAETKDSREIRML